MKKDYTLEDLSQMIDQLRTDVRKLENNFEDVLQKTTMLKTTKITVRDLIDNLSQYEPNLSVIIRDSSCKVSEIKLIHEAETDGKDIVVIDI